MIFTLTLYWVDCLAAPHLVLPLKLCLLPSLEDIPLSPHFAQYCLFLGQRSTVVFTDVRELSYMVMHMRLSKCPLVREVLALEVPHIAVYISLGCGRADHKQGAR